MLSFIFSASRHAFHAFGPGRGCRGHSWVDVLGFSVVREFRPPNEYSVMYVPFAFVISAIVVACGYILTLFILSVSWQSLNASMMQLSWFLWS